MLSSKATDVGDEAAESAANAGVLPGKRQPTDWPPSFSRLSRSAAASRLPSSIFATSRKKFATSRAALNKTTRLELAGALLYRAHFRARAAHAASDGGTAQLVPRGLGAAE